MASRAIEGTNFGLDLCKVLNLDPKKTRTITIISAPNDAVMVNVEQYLQDSETQGVIDIIMKFKYVKKDDKNKNK